MSAGMSSGVEAGGKPMELLRATGDDGDFPGWKKGDDEGGRAGGPGGARESSHGNNVDT